MVIKIQDLEHIRQAASQLLSQVGDSRVLAFYGKMGAGKTTFIKALCEELGVQDVITSPTFAIVNEYTAPSPTTQPPSPITQPPSPTTHHPSPIYHFDFYRIKKLEEVYDMGYEDYFYSGAWCLIEWPELIEELLPDDTLRVTIAEEADGSRTLTF